MLLRLCLLAVLVSLGVLSAACSEEWIYIQLNNMTGRELRIEVSSPNHKQQVYTVGPGEVGSMGKILSMQYPGKAGDVVSFTARTTTGVATGTGSCKANN